ncbi:AMP-binding protein, partial [Actinocrinis puniceicyclus]|uniref:AMP-binding protein n=1 Tax=Actinocrinis puniceicyclus TaxID=977794 RepID=UPI0028A69D57
MLPGVEDIVGLLMNTVPVRVRLDGAESVAGLLARVQREQAGLGAHHHVGLADIQRLAGLGELFDTSTVFENAPFDRDAVHAALPGLRISGIDDSAAPEGTHYPLSLAAFPGERLRLELNYRQDVFTAEQAELITQRLRLLLETFVCAPGTPIARIEVQTPGERSRLVEHYNATDLPTPPGTLPELFARQAALTPDEVAVVFEDETLTYAGLDAAATSLARRLCDLGAGPDRFVALALPRGVQAVVAILAALKSGAAYVPVDPDDPAERLAGLIAETSPFAVVTTQELARRLDLPAGTACVSPQDTGEVPPESGPWHAPVPQPRDLAYAIYTSGSTGRPKAVAIEHRALANMFHSHHRNFFAPEAAAAGRRLRVALTNALTFDASWSQLLWMVAGHELHVVSDDVRRDARAVVDYVGKHEIDLLDTTPGYARELLSAGLLDGDGHRPRVLALGGEAISDAMWEQLRASSFASVYNLYGPTECTIDAMFCQVRDTDRPALGRPAANTRVYVLDGWLRPVPPGVVGEVYIGGANLARGYWG